MEITITTPALLFPAISLLLLAYTNRFLVLANLIRELHNRYKSHPEEIIMAQLSNLRKRIFLIRFMQATGVLGLFFCVFCMFLLFGGFIFMGEIVFGISLILLMVSLASSAWEIHISIGALTVQLSDIEKEV